MRDTARDPLAWLVDPQAGARRYPSRAARVRTSGITRDRELAVRAAWHAKQNG